MSFKRINMRKRVIEWNIPITDISKASIHEKSVRHGHPSTLHLWWARRPLAASRTTTFAALLDLPYEIQEQNKTLKLISELAPWNVLRDNDHSIINIGQKILKKQWKNDPPKVLDPFSGGGSIPLEALRLGCVTYANDLNPVAVLIGKATLEWPQQLADPNLVTFVEEQAKHIEEKVRQRIGHFYPCDCDGLIPIGYLWARVIQCTNNSCLFEIPLIKHFWLARKKSRKIAYKPILERESQRVKFVIQADDEIDFNPSEGTVIRANVRCLACGIVIRAQKVRAIAQEGGLSHRLIVVILRSKEKTGKIYRIATKEDMEWINEAKMNIQLMEKSQSDLNLFLPNENLPPKGTLGFGVQQYGMTKWIDLFNPRQLFSHVIFAEEIKKQFPIIQEQVNTKFPENPEMAFKAICAYLTLIFGRLVDKNASLVVYNVYGEKIEHVFGRTALPMAWDYVELNVFSGANGDWSKQTEWVLKFLDAHIWKAKTSSRVILASVTSLPYANNFFDAILTDPPYYDNIPYSDLSDYFYIWFKRILGDVFPTLFATPLTPKLSELVANKGRQKNPKIHFEDKMRIAFQEMNRTLKHEGIMVIVYAHKSVSGWVSLLSSVIQAGFVITASWPIHTEMRTRLRARTSAALASSIYLVCRKIPQKERGYISELTEDLETKIWTFLQRTWEEGIRGGDFFIAAIGSAMSLLSRYKELRRYSGELVTLEDQLKIIRRISTNFLLNNLIGKGASVTLDNLAQFYLAFRWTYQDRLADFGEAQVLGQACGINLDKLAIKDDLVRKKGSKLSLADPTCRKQVESRKNDYVNVMHLLVNAWEKNDMETLKEALQLNKKIISPTFWQFCQAVAECLPKTNQEKHYLEGLLASQYSKPF